MSTVRVVRPRPLGLTDRIPVYWPGNEPSQELKQIDGGALYRQLVAASTPTANRKRKRTETYHAPKEGEAHEHFSPARKSSEQQAKDAGPIAVPQVRQVQDYQLNQEAAAHRGPSIKGDIAAAPYVRHQQVHAGIHDDHYQAEYNIDDEDVTWLNNINIKNGQGLFAAAVGLYRQMSQRISGSSEASTPRAQEVRLSVDEFERAIDALELAHFAAVKAWWDKQNEGPSTSAPQIPKIPAMKSLLARAAALDIVAGVVPDRKLAAQLLDYWMGKRHAEGGPLLARLWFEQPWKLVAFSRILANEDDDFDEHLPFMAVEPRSAHKQRRTAANRRRISEEDAVEALFNMRNELEMLRTLADQVRKREKLKRQLLLLAQQEMQMRQQLGLSPSAPVPKTARLHQLARQTTVTAAGTAAAGPGLAESSAAAAARAATAAAGRAGNNARQSPQPAPDINRIVAKAADAAAAAASPHEGERPRQTRTAAAAAAAAFELAFAAKRAKVAEQAGLTPKSSRLGQLEAVPAQAATNVPPATHRQPETAVHVSRRANQAAAAVRQQGSVRGRGQDRGISRRRNADPAAAGDADDEKEDSMGRPVSRVQALQDQRMVSAPPKRRRLGQPEQQLQDVHQHDVAAATERSSRRGRVHDQQPQVTVQHVQEQQEEAAAAETSRRRRRVQVQQSQQPAVPEQAQQKQARGQQQQLVKQRGRQKQQQRQEALAAVGAAFPDAAAEVSMLSNSSASESDDSADADYTVSSEEQDVVQDRPHRRQQLRLSQQRRTQQHRRGRKRATAGSSSDGSSSDHAELVDESDDDFQAPSRAAVALRRAQQSQQLQLPRQRSVAPAADQQVAAAGVVLTPRRPCPRVGHQPAAALQQVHQVPSKEVTLKQGLQLRSGRNGFVSRPLQSPAAAASDSEASSGRHARSAARGQRHRAVRVHTAAAAPAGPSMVDPQACKQPQQRKPAAVAEPGFRSSTQLNGGC